MPIAAVPRASAAIRRSTGSRCSASEFQRLGVVGDWDDPYATMTYAAEAQIVREIGKFLLNGGALSSGAKPVMWSVVEKTALAEAEIEYHDHTSTTVWVRFPVVTPRRAGAGRRLGGDLDHHALDHAGQPRDRLRRRARLRARRGRRRRPRAALARSARGWWSARAAGRRSAEGRRHRRRHQVERVSRAPRLAGTVCAPSAARPAATTSTCRCCPATSSPPMPAPASSISRRATAPTTSTSAARTACRCRTRSADDGTFYDHVPLFAGMHVYKAASRATPTAP